MHTNKDSVWLYYHLMYGFISFLPGLFSGRATNIQKSLLICTGMTIFFKGDFKKSQ